MVDCINYPRNGVTIGMPLFNEEKYIEATIRSAALQCEVLWISDNASNDRTAAICDELSREFNNINFVRQKINQGAMFNFNYVLNKTTTPYFMWLGGHDMLSPEYVQKLVKLLEKNPDAVLAYGASQHIDASGVQTGKYEYFYHDLLEDESDKVRTLGLIRHLTDCSILHGLFRTKTLLISQKETGAFAYRGLDHVLLGHAALKGKFVYDPNVYLIRRDVHLIDTTEDQLIRLEDKIPNQEQLSFRMMQRRHYALAVQVSKNNGLSGLMFRIKARYYLVERFGPFGEVFITYWLDKLLELFRFHYSFTRLISKFLIF